MQEILNQIEYKRRRLPIVLVDMYVGLRRGDRLEEDIRTGKENYRTELNGMRYARKPRNGQSIRTRSTMG